MNRSAEIERRPTADLEAKGYTRAETLISTAQGSDTPENLALLMSDAIAAASRVDGAILIHPDNSPRVEMWVPTS